MFKSSKFFLLAASLCSAWLLAGLELDKNTRLPIVYPDNDANPGTVAFLKLTAEKLQRAFKETLGATLEVVPASKMKNASAKAIFLGDSPLLRKMGKRGADFKNFDCLIAEKAGSILLAGFDGHRIGSKEQASNHGAYILGSTRAAVIFMEKFLGVRFLAPGEVGTDYLPCKKVVVPDNFRLESSHNLRYALGREPDFFYDYSSSLFGQGRYHTHGGHSYYKAVPKNVYAKTHPHYFAQTGDDPLIRDSSNNHLCLGNKEVQELIFKQMLKDLDAGADITQLAQTDAMTQCRCKLCRAMPHWNDPGEWVWLFHRSLAQRLLKERPGKKVLIICYAPNWDPPKTFKSFPANTAVELCKYDTQPLEAWKNYTVPQGFHVYIYNWGDYVRCGMTPKRTPEFCANQAREFLKFGVKGLYRCGFGENFGLEGPAYYVYGKILENPALDEKLLTGEFINRAYRESAAPMKRFFETLYNKLEIFHAAETTIDARDILNMIYTPETLTLLERHLKRAESMAKQPKVRRRLTLVRFEFDYIKATVRPLTLYTAYRTTPSKHSLEALLQALDERNKFIASIPPAGNPRLRLPGWKEVRLLGGKRSTLHNNGRLSALIGAPLEWDTAHIRRLGVLPGTQVKKLEILPVTGKVPFDNFETGVWAKAPWHKLSGIQLEPLKEQTSFKMLYDKENLYVAVKAELKGNRKHTAVGKDGAFWRQNAVELLIDPKGERELCYHLAWNPPQDSWYDAAKGLITDPLNPKYGKSDPSWNGDWRYLTRQEKDMWYSMAVIPFKNFGVRGAPGVIWTLNVGREIRYPAATTGTDLDQLGLWAPNLSSRIFADTNAFGEAVFK